MRLIRKLIPMRTMTAVAVLFLGWQVWVFLKSDAREYTEREKDAIANVCAEAAAVVREAVGTNSGVRFGVVHFSNDPRDEVTSGMRESLGRTAGANVPGGSVVLTFLKDVSKAVTEASSLEEVLGAGHRVGLDVLVLGKVETVAESSGVGRVKLKVSAFDARKGSFAVKGLELAGSAVSRSSGSGLGGVAGECTMIRNWVRVALGILGFLLPWGLVRLVEKAMESKSNLGSGVLLGGCLVAQMALSAAAFPVAFGAGWRALLVGIGWLVYDYVVLEQIARRC